MKEAIAGVLLAGGLSRRMGGGDKALLRLAGRPLIAYAADCLRDEVCALALNANGDPARFAPLGLPVIADETPDFPGPLAGILAALRWAERTRPAVHAVVSVPADSPFIPRDLVQRLAAAHAAAPDRPAVAQSRGRRHHVTALWPLAVAPRIAAALARGHRRVEAMVDSLDAIAVPFPDVTVGSQAIDPFLNINTPEDLAAAERLLAHAPFPSHKGGGNAPFVFAVAGWKNSGKTTLVARLVAHLTDRGFRLATVKHSHHHVSDERDGDGTDSARHRRAGAHAVALSTPDRWALIGPTNDIAWQDGPPPPLDEIVARLPPVDIVIVEGMKRAAIPKIEVRRTGQGQGPPLAGADATVFAIASDRPLRDAPVPVFDCDDIAGLTDAALAQRSAMSF